MHDIRFEALYIRFMLFEVAFRIFATSCSHKCVMIRLIAVLTNMLQINVTRAVATFAA